MLLSKVFPMAGSLLPSWLFIVVVCVLLGACSGAGSVIGTGDDLLSGSAKKAGDKLTDKDPDFPNLLTFDSGAPVATREQWAVRRLELIAHLESNLYGATPAVAKDKANWVTTYSHDETWDGIRVNGVDKATYRQLKITWTNTANGRSVTADLITIVPKGETNVPVILMQNFRGNQALFSHPAVRTTSNPIFRTDKAVRPASGHDEASWEYLIDRGIGLATFHYRDVFEDLDMNKNTGAPAFNFGEGGSFNNGVLRMFYPLGQTTQREGEWGAIGAWAWGLSRIMDHFETIAEVDATRVLLVGHSRLGLTANWAGAQDDRFFSIVNTSMGGLYHRYGLTSYCKDLDDASAKYEYWYEMNYRRGRLRSADWHNIPVDSHANLALLAPRAVLAMVGARDCSGVGDEWVNIDPEGSFDAAYYAGKVYELYNPAFRFAAIDYSDITDNVDIYSARQLIDGRIAFAIDPDDHNLSDEDFFLFINWATKQGWH
jgi:hypothetical protein